MKLRIDGVLYDVEHRPPSEMDGEAGSVSTDKQVIRLSTDLGPQAEMYVLAHEITHSLLEWGGLACLLDEKMQEAICDALGAGWIRVIHENPGLVAAVAERFGFHE